MENTPQSLDMQSLDMMPYVHASYAAAFVILLFLVLVTWRDYSRAKRKHQQLKKACDS